MVRSLLQEVVWIVLYNYYVCVKPLQQPECAKDDEKFRPTIFNADIIDVFLSLRSHGLEMQMIRQSVAQLAKRIY